MIKLIFLTAFSWLNADNASDSLRLETINGKQYVIHQVDEKETLYAISRRYGTSITAIIDANPDLSTNLVVGNELRVPYTAKAKPATAQSNAKVHQVQAGETLYAISRKYGISVEDLKAWNGLTDPVTLDIGQELRLTSAAGTRPNPSTTPTDNRQPTTTTAGYHTVAAGETLYAISRKYNVTVDQLKSWNNLTGNDVKVGQSLAVAAATPTVATPISTPKPVVPKPSEESQQASSRTETPKPTVPATTETIRISENVTGTDEIKETGLAELIEGTEGNRKYLAMHRSAKAGTIMKVRNELNNREVFVRVVGNLPATGVNDKLVIKISKSAYDRLGAIDDRFRVEVTYYK